jgi:hypothetical protein
MILWQLNINIVSVPLNGHEAMLRKVLILASVTYSSVLRCDCVLSRLWRYRP